MKYHNEQCARKTDVDFGCKHITGAYIEAAELYPIGERTIVINVSDEDIVLSGDPVTRLAPRKSLVSQDTTIVSAKQVLLVNVVTQENLGNVVLQDGWQLASDIFGEGLNGVPLWRSPITTVGSVIQPDIATFDQSPLPVCDIKVNLWYAPSRTDCAIHNHETDDFIEYHTQIVGVGRMQKFKEERKESLYEDIILAEGNTHELFCVVNDPVEQRYDYPWHQYYSDTDCIWLVTELHPRR